YVRALLLTRRTNFLAPAPAPAPVKAVELSCVTCGGAHSHQNCPATHGNDYRDNISEYVSQAAAANYNQVSSLSDLKWLPNHIRLQNQLHRPQVNQSPAYQAPVPQTHGVSKTDFERYVTANDAVLRNMQNQGQNLQSQMANLTDMLSKFVTAKHLLLPVLRALPVNPVTTQGRFKRKLGDPGKIPDSLENFQDDECLALAIIGASIILMHFQSGKSFTSYLTQRA
ncbi:hypothetical protein Tco_0304372, partial [Tanacetum coccineum]